MVELPVSPSLLVTHEFGGRPPDAFGCAFGGILGKGFGDGAARKAKVIP